MKIIAVWWAGIAQSVHQIAIGWTVRGLNPGEGEIYRTRSDRSWGPNSLLCNGYRFPLGGKAAGAWCSPPTAKLKKEHNYTFAPSLGLHGLS